MFGFEIYSENGKKLFSAGENIACFVGSSKDNAISIGNAEPAWVWFGVTAFVSDAQPIYEHNMPSNLCYLRDKSIVVEKGPGENVEIFWGIV
ncbi:hypothetical protein [Suttonella ornithocola]|uniref:Uncharacterized protein n=1 Tax=Suttonella ornithocola TaxID=279832 RepID=A0A380MSK8_9GAMM|nr:hypothetical protein [Suttonella ornithocola]SUO95292.1 Uncharacterised protein [Suttonella ornithocola]SUQ09750.1 Uncharacterised protein [Suttonella ornithocola]